MGGHSVKTIILLMVLVVLSILIGAQITDGFANSLGAFAIIACVVVLFLLLWMGKNSWYLIFLLPPIVENLPIPFIDGTLAVFASTIVIFFYHYIQCKVMGHARLRWHSFIVADLLIFVITIYMAISYYLHPVAINALGLDMEFVGGQTYIYALGAVFYYIALSSLEARQPELEKLIKIACLAQFVGITLKTIISLKSGNVGWAGGQLEGDLSQNVGEERIIVFAGLGYFILTYCYASRPLGALWRSPLHLLGVIGAIAAVSLSGARNFLINCVLYVMGISWVRRETCVLISLGVAVWVLLLGLGSGGAIESLPYMTQRFIAVVPGIQVASDVRRSVDGSSLVRRIAWEQAFEPKNGYIKDYIWGDGFQLSKKELGRDQVAHLRGTAEAISVENNLLARTGNWHNGFIATMHRLGLVGCLLFYIVFFIGMALFYRVGSYYVGKPLFPFYCLLTMKTFAVIFNFSYNACSPVTFFKFMIDFACVKLLYTELRDNGVIEPFTLSRRYVPMTIREIENQHG